MDVLVERCAGLDVHRDSVMATVRLPGTRRRQREQHKRAFASTTAELHALGDWLQGFGVTLVGMEATGVYWRPVFRRARAPFHLLADQRPASAQRPRSQE